MPRHQAALAVPRARAAAEAPATGSDDGSVEVLPRAGCGEILEEVYDRYRHAQPGALSRPHRWWALRAGQPPISPASRYVAVHRDAEGVPDGYASYSVESGTLTVDETVVTDDAVFAALARSVLGHDPVSKVVFKHVPPGHPLRWQFADFRAGEVSGDTDWLWVRLLDVPRALTARGWFTDGEIVLDVDDPFLGEHGRHLLTVRDGKADCVPTDRQPDLSLGVRDLVPSTSAAPPRARSYVPDTSRPTTRARSPSPTPCSAPTAHRTACTGSDRALAGAARVSSACSRPSGRASPTFAIKHPIGDNGNSAPGEVMAMPAWHLRDYHDDDLDQAIQIWDQSRQADEHRVFPVSEVMAAAKAGQTAVVAVVGGQLVGMAVAQAHDKRGWILLVALASRWRERGIGSALLTELERRLRALGVRHVSALLPAGAAGTKALENSGYQSRTDLTYYEKLEPPGTANADVLAALGGRVLPEGLWDAMAGMEREKQIVERRVVLPLTEPALADRYGVVPPKSIILFGPPGTGKTSFAKAVASRLGWPFVELFPSRLAADTSEGLAVALREAFADLAELDSVLLFIDEVEEIAGVRSGKAVDPGHGVTNELLKLIPVFREHDARLLACATNSVRSLDAAFLRPGRFDHVIPIGPPDPTARAAIWARYLKASGDSVDLGQLVEASELFTPADIEFAARKGAQAAFEYEVTHREGRAATTEDYMTAIGDTRPTLTPHTIEEFTEDIDKYSRL